ncbi:hypothetical protein [Paenibacillus sp. DYY-L-2]|uniref:hypothetical protein n=1 Tax=Paenibacillus sp. DYY-L-2 TaxID=3447013 RepID=UPI003F501CF3
MKQSLVRNLLLLLLFMVTTACSNHDGSTDWAYGFIKWKGISYKVTDETLLRSEIGSRLGHVESFTDDENFSGRSTYSNEYPAGTGFFKINGSSEKDAIAVESDGEYIKLTRAE